MSAAADVVRDDDKARRDEIEGHRYARARDGTHEPPDAALWAFDAAAWPADLVPLDFEIAAMARHAARQREQATAAVAGIADDWPEPEPLVATFQPVPYPRDALPDTIRAAAEEAHQFTQAPFAMVATCALAAVSIAAQSLADVRRAAKLEGPASLFTLVIGDSGERKSSVDRLFTRAIEDFQREREAAAKPEIERHEADRKAWEAKGAGIREKIKALAKDGKPTARQESELRDLERDKPTPPAVPRLLYADSTPEALAYGLAHYWPSAGLTSAEAGTVLGGHAMASESIMRSLSLLNQLWDGRDLRIDRRKEAGSFTVAGARLTVGLQIQESTLRAFCDRAGALARGSGFWARFLFAWPASTQGTRFFREPPESWPAMTAFNRRMAELLRADQPVDDAGKLAPPMLDLSPDAKAAWIKFHDAIEAELSDGGELRDVRDAASKTADNAARLAALFHIFEGCGGDIGAAHMRSAARIALWHLHESRRFFGEMAQPDELADAARLDEWLIKHCRRERMRTVPTREAQRLGPIRDKARLTAALAELEGLGRARPIRDGRRRGIELNPALAVAS